MDILADVLSATILFAVPLLLVALGGMFSERSGIINLALEGIMIIGALIGCHILTALDEAVTVNGMGSQLAVLIALLAAGAAGVIFSLLLAFSAINLKADQTIGGTALNQFAPAFSIVLTWAILGQGQTTMTLPKWTRLTQANFGMEKGTGFFERFAFTSLYLTTFLTIVIFAAAVVLLYKTKFGLRLRSCGEHPQAAASVGINVYRMRYAGVMISGFLAGVGGMAFVFAVGGFQSDVAGYGFLALAVMIFGNWKPWSILGAALFFSFFRVIGNYAASIPFMPKFEEVNGVSTYLWPMIPYVVTMILLILTSKKSRAPKAEGIPYDKGQR
ncbi:MAG: ABC transporter permease [Ruminococcaceae bacterium]|nr:ABC transporter permease [Oscillospiraceae bacterium]